MKKFIRLCKNYITQNSYREARHVSYLKKDCLVPWNFSIIFSMLPKDKQRLISYYENSLKEHGEGAQAVHWINQDTQKIRFEILSKIADLNNKKILDVGCGLGDLYQFLVSKNITVDYTGIDIVPEFIDKAKKRFPAIKFEIKDANYLSENYDYILASGALSFKVEDGKNYYFSLIRKMFEHARYGIAFNMLNGAVHNADETYLTYNIAEVSA